MLLRSKGEDGKYRFLLQQRDDGTWGMPGGQMHAGEDPWAAAQRETCEEIGSLPGKIKVVRTFHHMDDPETQVFLYMCDTKYFRPDLNGSTPEETRGVGWFRRKEIDDLNLTPKFREDWDGGGVSLRENVTKAMDRNNTGEVITDPAQNAQGGGGRWNYPHRGDATEVPGPGAMPHPSRGRPGGGQAPTWVDDHTDTFRATPYMGGNDGDFGKSGYAPAAEDFPDQGMQDQDRYPAGGIGSRQSPGGSVGGQG